MAIRLYGEYFVDQRERHALTGLFVKMAELHAWPVKEAHESLKRRWEVLDSLEF